MENNGLPVPKHQEFQGKKYLLALFYNDRLQKFPCDRLEDISGLDISLRGMKRAILYAHLDNKHVTCSAYGESLRPYWSGGVYEHRSHFERELKKLLNE